VRISVSTALFFGRATEKPPASFFSRAWKNIFNHHGVLLKSRAVRARKNDGKKDVGESAESCTLPEINENESETRTVILPPVRTQAKANANANAT